jgi:hypothetical protein
MRPISTCLPVVLVGFSAGTLAARGDEPAPAYPRSPVIAGLDWAPVGTIVRRARDGDNWPVTWADDALSTTVGDGTGRLHTR